MTTHAHAIAVHDITPDALVEPATAVAVADALSACSADGRRVEPVGAGTWTGWGAPPRPPYVALSTRRLTGIEQYRPEDLTVTVAAGTPIETLQSELRRNRQWLALDPPTLPGATIGATIATASAGPLRAGYGTPRDHVLGVEIATGDGQLLQFGGQVVKNVAGYDIVRPITGSFGSLGVITRVSLRLRPLPPATATLAIPVTQDAAPATAFAIRQAWPVVAIELLGPRLAADVLAHDRPADSWTMLVRLHGHPEEVAEGTRRVRAAASADSTMIPEDCWLRLSQSEAAARWYVRLSARPGALQEVLQIAKSLSDHTFHDISRTAVHAADGIVRLWSVEEPVGLDPTSAIEAAGQQVASIDGTLIYRVGPGTRERRDDRRAQLEAGIRRLFDPAGILPGYRL
jgi:glycolate oxidase FAD binding subunit